MRLPLRLSTESTRIARERGHPMYGELIHPEYLLGSFLREFALEIAFALLGWFLEAI
jgi:hypothetical protein